MTMTMTMATNTARRSSTILPEHRKIESKRRWIIALWLVFIGNNPRRDSGSAKKLLRTSRFVSRNSLQRHNNLML